MNLKKKSNDRMASSSSTKHPKVSEMVLLAIAMLNERNGSSLQAIKKYIINFFNVDGKNIAVYIKRYLLMAVASGTLVQTKGKGASGSFRLGGAMKLKLSELLTISNGNDANSSASHSEKATPSTSAKKQKKPKSK